MRTLIFVLLFTLIAHAEEPTPFRWPAHPMIPQRISDGAVLANLSLDAWKSLVKTDTRTRLSWSCRTLADALIPMAAKAIWHRTRPNGKDDKSFFSQHTAFAAGAAHSPLTASLALTVGWGRAASGMHFGTDVGVGALTGILDRMWCDEVAGVKQ